MKGGGMIKKVKLKNWRSHADSELIFSTGTNALLGILGSGKTSVLDAICFALFGTFPNLQMRKLKLDDVIMKKPEKKNRAEIEVEFELNGSIYGIKRIIERGKGTVYSEFNKDGKVLESPSTQRVTEIVEKTLKVNYDLFSKAIYAEQNNIDYFLTLGKGQRMKKIDELLMIEKFERARSTAVTLTNKIAERMVGKESIIQQIDVDGIKNVLKEMKESVKKLKEEKRRLEDEKKEVKVERGRLDVEVRELRKIYDNLQILKRRESGVESAIKETERVLSELKIDVDNKELVERLQKILTKIDELNKKLEKKQNEYEKLSKELAESKSKIEFLRNEKIEKLEKEIKAKLKLKKEFDRLRSFAGKDAKKKLVEKTELQNNLMSELTSLNVKIGELKEVLATLSMAEGKCPVCDSKLSDKRRMLLIEKKKQELNALEKKINEVEEEKLLTEKEVERLKTAIEKMNELLIEIKNFDETKRELKNAKQLFKQYNESTVKLDNQLSELRKEMKEMREELKKAESNRQQLQFLRERVEECKDRENRLKELIEKREKLRKHLTVEERRVKGRELEKLESKLNTILIKEREIEMKIANIENLVHEREERIREYEAELEQLKKDKDEVARLGKLVRELKIFAEALKNTQVQLRENFISAVNLRMTELWPTLYPYRDFTSIRLAIEGGDYVLQLQERSGAWTNVEGIASGGERSIACLALRIAFALVLAPQLPLLILDEPTANLDRRAVSVLAETLRERIKDFTDQCFIITHDEALEEAVTGYAYRLERDKEKDGVTKVFSISG